jgi:hypothetical protein
MPSQQEVTFESAMRRLKQHVYKTRLRVKDFLQDFDRLRLGEISPAQFKSAMSMAGARPPPLPAMHTALALSPRAPTPSPLALFQVWTSSCRPPRSTCCARSTPCPRAPAWTS